VEEQLKTVHIFGDRQYTSAELPEGSAIEPTRSSILNLKKWAIPRY